MTKVIFFIKEIDLLRNLFFFFLCVVCLVSICYVLRELKLLFPFCQFLKLFLFVGGDVKVL